MLHLFMKKGPWFRAKQYGYGAGLPLNWQGWAVVAFYLLAVGGIGAIASRQAMPHAGVIALFVIVTMMFIAICRHRTEGGWKWRWGE